MPDHYRILGVQRDASDADIKKAYRKEALRWHPDKNPDNKEVAEKRFKDISQAFKVLSNPDERAHFDRYGSEAPQRPRGPGGHGGGQPMYAEDLSPEDIFNMFFGIPPGGARRPHAHQQQQQHFHRQRHDGAGVQVSMTQLLPIILLLLFSLLSSLSSGDSRTSYSFTAEDPHVLERRTLGSGVRYFVDDTFALVHTSGASLREIETKVEADNFRRVERRCRHERGHKQRMNEAAGHYSGEQRDQYLDAAARVAQPWCDEKAHLEATRVEATRAR
jgi:DnaJ family protein B protein 12